MAEEQKHNIMTAESLKKLQERYDYLPVSYTHLTLPTT